MNHAAVLTDASTLLLLVPVEMLDTLMTSRFVSILSEWSIYLRVMLKLLVSFFVFYFLVAKTYSL